jgi:hypothetical protein
MGRIWRTCSIFVVLVAVAFWAVAAVASPFKDVTTAAGVGDPGRGKGVAVADVDRDGDLDIYVSNKGGPNVLYRNDGGNTFTDITEIAGDNVGDAGFCMGSVFADVDHDGDMDLFIAKGGNYEVEANRLLRNDSTPGKVWFTDITAEAGLLVKAFTYGASFADYDSDGDVDLYLANYGVGKKNMLFRNDSRDGQIRFTDVTAKAGVGDGAWSWSASWGDVNGDGHSDLYVVNGRYPAGEPNKLYMNNGDGTFRDVSVWAGVADPNWGLGAAFADVDNDNDLDLFVSNYVGPNKMFLNDGTGRFTDISTRAKLDNKGWGKGPTFGDINHDGLLDLYEGDCKFSNQLYLNKGNGTFADIVEQFPAMKCETVRTKGTVFADFDNDGDLDLYVINWNAPNRLYENAQNDGNWLKVRSVGTVSNADAVGSKVRVYASGKLGVASALKGLREVTTAQGFCTQVPTEVHFGLDGKLTYDVEVVFPSGQRVVASGVKAGQTITVTEPRMVVKK